MAYVRRQHQRVLHRPPNAADRAGMASALRALYCSDPMTPEEIAAHEHRAQAVPYRKVQGDLQLQLPQPDAK